MTFLFDYNLLILLVDEEYTLRKILPGDLTLSGAYWFKTDSSPLTSRQCTVILNILYL